MTGLFRAVQFYEYIEGIVSYEGFTGLSKCDKIYILEFRI
jgi:hypothetical protein